MLLSIFALVSATAKACARLFRRKGGLKVGTEVGSESVGSAVCICKHLAPPFLPRLPVWIEILLTLTWRCVKMACKWGVSLGSNQMELSTMKSKLFQTSVFHMAQLRNEGGFGWTYMEMLTANPSPLQTFMCSPRWCKRAKIQCSLLFVSLLNVYPSPSSSKVAWYNLQFNAESEIQSNFDDASCSSAIFELVSVIFHLLRSSELVWK